MIRGTTPTLTFTLPFSAADIERLSVAFAQKPNKYAEKSVVVLEKCLTDCAVKNETIELELTEDDTLALNCDFDVEIQLRAQVLGKKMASDIITVPVGRILKDGCLE